MTLLALIGAKALLYLYVWLISAIVSSYLSNRKGYGEKPGLATGLVLTAVGIVVWLIVPARADSKWKAIGPFGRGDRRQLAQRSSGG
jgi:fucose permease